MRAGTLGLDALFASMIEVRCPLPDCGMLWDRKTPAPDTSIHRINCRCKRTITYRVGIDGDVTVLAQEPRISRAPAGGSR